MEYKNFILLFQQAVQENWDSPALSDFKKTTITYKELAKRIETFDLVWKKAGLGKGDHIAVNAKGSASEITAFIAAVSKGYVAVQLYNAFTPADTEKLVAHSDSRVLFTEKHAFASMDFDRMPEVLCVIDTPTGEILAVRDGFGDIFASGDELFNEKYPEGMKPSDFTVEAGDFEDVNAILYTSGSTGNPKGVMLTCRNFSSNVAVITPGFPYHPKENYLSLLPHAHSFGLTCDVIIPLTLGMHVTVLGVPPIPSNVHQALLEVHPRLLYGVPLIFVKFAEYILGPDINSPEGKAKLDAYKDNPEYCEMLRDKLMSAMGGNMEEFATGGSAIPSEVESLLVYKLKLPFITGYGLTECAPIISYGKVGRYIPKSCGEYMAEVMELRIDSPDPERIAGELYVKGDVVFKGYYKNPETTAEVLSEDGWFRTGDIGTVDSERNVFLLGRCKNIILTENGQNIYPEELEVVLNELPYVAESIVLQRGSRVVALIVPRMDALDKAGLDAQALDGIMHQNIAVLNSKFPSYSAVNEFELRFEPFAKTPKGSIRRFLYK